MFWICQTGGWKFDFLSMLLELEDADEHFTKASFLVVCLLNWYSAELVEVL